MKVLQFRYNGGSRPGEYRNIVVSHEDNRLCSGYDVEAHGPRKFFQHQISPI